METEAVVFEAPERLSLSRLALPDVGENDVAVDIEFSGISTGTERLLWLGQMPSFPGMGYPLVPGYESVGRVSHAGPNAQLRIGDHVFVPGARCYGEVRGLFGGASRRVIVPAQRVTKIAPDLDEKGILLALAATAYHVIAQAPERPPELIAGHGVLGRLLARVTMALGHPAPLVYERNASRSSGANGYRVCTPDTDPRRDYRVIADVSGNPELLDPLIARLAPAGEVVLAGFYAQPLTFSFPPAFMREARLRIAAEWQPSDLTAILALVQSGALSLEGLITHRRDAAEAAQAYDTAFRDPECLKMVLHWRGRA